MEPNSQGMKGVQGKNKFSCHPCLPIAQFFSLEIYLLLVFYMYPEQQFSECGLWTLEGVFRRSAGLKLFHSNTKFFTT